MKKKRITLPSNQAVTRILLATTIVLALLAGLYQELYKVEQKKYAKIEDMYVRVRTQLGRVETQRLIDQSYKE